MSSPGAAGRNARVLSAVGPTLAFLFSLPFRAQVRQLLSDPQPGFWQESSPKDIMYIHEPIYKISMCGEIKYKLAEKR